MINDKAILVGVDGSHASYKATWWAANYAKHAGLTLQIVCAYSLPSYAAVSFDATYTAMGDDNAAHNDAQEILSKAKAIADEQGVEASTLIVTGDPASVFVELSRNYNLIVIGNRGKGGLAERLLGTTSSSLPAYAYCPIVVVPYTDDEGQPDALEQHHHQGGSRLRRIQVGSEGVEIAAAFADSWGAELDVISAVPNMKGSEDEGVMASFQEDLDVRIKPLEEAYPNLKINKQIVPGPAAGALTKASYDHDVCRGRLPWSWRLHRSAAWLHQPGSAAACGRTGLRGAAQVCGSRGDPSRHRAELACRRHAEGDRRHQGRRGSAGRQGQAGSGRSHRNEDRSGPSVTVRQID